MLEDPIRVCCRGTDSDPVGPLKIQAVKPKLAAQNLLTNRALKGWFSKLGSLLGSFSIRVPYYIGHLKRDPNLENCPTGEFGIEGVGR